MINVTIAEKPTKCQACGKEIPTGEAVYSLLGKDYCNAYCACEGERVGER